MQGSSNQNNTAYRIDWYKLKVKNSEQQQLVNFFQEFDKQHEGATEAEFSEIAH